MCKYCNKIINNELINDIDNDKDDTAEIVFLKTPMLNIKLEEEDPDGYKPEDFFPINYCPMCGRKLGE